MSSKNKVVIVSVSSAVVIIGLLAFFLSGNGHLIRRALQTQEQLVAKDSPLAGRARQNALDQMMRDVDKLDRDELRKLWSEVRDRQRAALNEAMDSYFAAAATQRDSILDEHIALMDQWRDVYEAIRTDSFSGRGGRGRRGGGGRDGVGGRPGGGPPGGGREGGGPGGGRRDRAPTDESQQAISDEEKAKRVEERKRYTDYFTALEARREKTKKSS